MSDIESYSGLLKQLNAETKLHCENTALICEQIAKKIELDPEIAYKIGYLHDIGKIYIPSRILRKNGALTPLEREIIDLHSYYGYHILKSSGEAPVIYLPTLFHHGLFKPRLHGIDEPVTELILRYVYLIHSVDIYEAMLSKRVYHNPKTVDDVVSLLQDDWLSSRSIITELKNYYQINNSCQTDT